MKQIKIALFILLISIIIFLIPVVSAHYEPSSPYGIEVTYKAYGFECYLAAGADKIQAERICTRDQLEVDRVRNFDGYDIVIKREYGDVLYNINRRAAENKDKSVCTEINENFKEFSNLRLIGSYEGKTIVERFLEDCYSYVDRASYIYAIPNNIKSLNNRIFSITSVLGIIYLFAILSIYGIRKAKLLYTLGIQIIISFFIIVIGFIANFGLSGAVISPVYNLLFYSSVNLIRIIITGIITSISTFLLIRLFLRWIFKELDLDKRKGISLFYTLVFNPFFFPIGILIGIMNLVYVKRITNKKQ